jgi:hypothetical protein
MAKPRVNAVEGVPCAQCNLGSVPYGNAVAWLVVAGVIGWIFLGTLRSPRRARG